MAKRKLGASIIILCIAAMTLVSGTYAWFLSGGMASLLGLGFGVIEGASGILVKGDAPTAEWGNTLSREDFTDRSWIKDGGQFAAITSVDGLSFRAVRLDSHIFTMGANVPTKDATDSGDMVYHDFKVYVKSDGDEIVGNDSSGAYMTINLHDKENEDEPGAAVAARVAVTINDTTRIYSIDGESYNAVAQSFSGEINDANSPYNDIIDGNDSNVGSGTLAAPANYGALKDGSDLTRIYLGNIPNKDSSGQEVHVKVWVEGNDAQCTSLNGNTFAGKDLVTDVRFYSGQ